jgi:hypothetical protein
MHLMVLLGYEAQVDDCFGPFGDSAILHVRLVHGLHRTYHRLENHFGQLLGDVGNVESYFGPFRDNVSIGAR